MAFPFFGQSAAKRSVNLPPPPPVTGPQPRRPGRRGLRSMLSQMFKAGSSDGRDAWSSIPMSPDMLISTRQPVLVARSREQWSNNDYARAFVRLVRTNVVGPLGVQLQAQVKKASGGYDKVTNAAIEAAFDEWCQTGNCDVTGTMTWRAIQALTAETTARDGEFIIRKIYGEDAGPWGFALQMIDPQRLPVRYENVRFGDNGNFVRQGIEFNRYGRPVAYHFSSTDEYNSYYYSIDGRGFERVPANEIIHGFVQEMVGQRRGLPWMGTSLFRLHHLQGFEDASVQNARAGAAKMGFITWKEGFGPEDDGEEIEIKAEPLSFHELPEGAEFKEFNPQYPNGEFQPFHKAMLRGAAAGMGVLYNNMAGDLDGVNFSSIRQGTLDEREHWKELQQWLIEKLIIPVFAEWLKVALLSGRVKTKTGRPVPASRLAQILSSIAWQARRWAWIDPNADVKAAVAAKNNLLMAPGQIIREGGRDPVTVYAEIANDIELMTEAGIPKEFIMASVLPEQWKMTVPADADSVGGEDPKTPPAADTAEEQPK